MNILHLATSIRGGAGIAALRSHRALLKNGLSSTILTNKEKSSRTDIVTVPTSLLGNLRSSSLTITQRKIIQSTDDLVTPISVSQLFEKTDAYARADIVHVHAFYNLLNIKDLKKISDDKRGIVVTLHDQRFFTGGCHYSRSCTQYKDKCSECPQTRFAGRSLIAKQHEMMRDFISNAKNLFFVAPSEWIMQTASESLILRGSQIEVIRNPIPDIYFSREKQLGSDRFRLGFISQNLENPYKGLPILLEALEKLSSYHQSNIEIFLIGKSKNKYFFKESKVNQFTVDNDSNMASVLANLNLVVIPSSQDNFPSVIGETLATGTRILGSNIGGIREALDNYSLSNFLPTDSTQLAHLIEIEMSQKQKEIDRETAYKEFSEKEYAKKISHIYSKSFKSI